MKKIISTFIAAAFMLTLSVPPTSVNAMTLTAQDEQILNIQDLIVQEVRNENRSAFLNLLVRVLENTQAATEAEVESDARERNVMPFGNRYGENCTYIRSCNMNIYRATGNYCMYQNSCTDSTGSL